jgi:hypothetical protein
MLRHGFVPALLTCGLFPAHSFGQKVSYAYNSFDVPGSTSTSGIGINNVGAIVGRFNDLNDDGHGFG